MKELFRWLVMFAGFANALILLPQLLMLLRKIDSDISLGTFIGFIVLQSIFIIHGVLESDWFLAGGMIASAIVCGAIVITTIYNRITKRRKKCSGK